MRIAVATDDGTTVAPHTGCCRGFVIYEVDQGQARRAGYMANVFTGYATGRCSRVKGGDDLDEEAEGCHVEHSHEPLLTGLASCGALIARGMGPRLINDLKGRSIDAVVCTEPDADRAAQRYATGDLERVYVGTCPRH